MFSNDHLLGSFVVDIFESDKKHTAGNQQENSYLVTEDHEGFWRNLAIGSNKWACLQIWLQYFLQPFFLSPPPYTTVEYMKTDCSQARHNIHKAAHCKYSTNMNGLSTSPRTGECVFKFTFLRPTWRTSSSIFESWGFTAKKSWLCFTWTNLKNLLTQYPKNIRQEF